MRAFASRLRNGMKLLRYLMGQRHDPQWLWMREAQSLESIAKFRRKKLFANIRIPYFVMADLKANCLPWFPAIVYFHIIGGHNVCFWYFFRMRRRYGDQSASKPVPTF